MKAVKVNGAQLKVGHPLEGFVKSTRSGRFSVVVLIPDADVCNVTTGEAEDIGDIVNEFAAMFRVSATAAAQKTLRGGK